MILLINGSINAGKTTVSKKIVELLPRTAHVEVDDLHDFVEWMPLDEAIPLNMQNTADVTRNFAVFGLNVVVSCPLRVEDYEFLLRELTSLGVPLHCITLDPSMAVALTNRGTRELTEWELRRIPQLYAEGIHSPPFGIIINNAPQTPDETAQEINRRIEGNNAAT